jgi:hypothetical protein
MHWITPDWRLMRDVMSPDSVWRFARGRLPAWAVLCFCVGMVTMVGLLLRGRTHGDWWSVVLAGYCIVMCFGCALGSMRDHTERSASRGASRFYAVIAVVLFLAQYFPGNVGEWVAALAHGGEGVFALERTFVGARFGPVEAGCYAASAVVVLGVLLYFAVCLPFRDQGSGIRDQGA